MNYMGVPRQEFLPQEPEVSFEGQWDEFVPIVAMNILLTIVTLGIYRFWAKARERRYLWSRTRFIDDTLEWTGTGLEMFRGFIVVMALLIPLFLFARFGFAAMAARGYDAAAAVLLTSLYLGVAYLGGVATFRVLRYKLSRTRWHGIRGGSDDAGWRYGVELLWRYAVGFLTFGLATPWVMTSLWRRRWNAMSYGSEDITVARGPATRHLMIRWLAIYVVLITAIVVTAVTGSLAVAQIARGGGEAGWNVGAIILSGVALYILLSLASLAFYAKFYRIMLERTSWAGLTLVFTARSRDWLMLVLGNIVLVVCTLGLGKAFVRYRTWAFFVRHLEGQGQVDLHELTQSETMMRTDAEGLAEAFEIGAL